MNEIVRLFLDTDMRLSFQGLKKRALSDKVDLSKLKTHEHVVFINARKDRVKLLSPNGVMSYLWKSDGAIDVGSIGQIAKTFSRTGKINVDASIKTELERKLKK